MLKYTDTQVTFAEIPDEITLCINISNCPCHCKGCHSPYLAEDIGEYLKMSTLLHLCDKYQGVSCISFMGGDNSPEDINFLASVIKKMKPELKVSWYSGRDNLSDKIDISNFDYIKLGPYIEKLGPLNSNTTNQRFYKVHKKVVNDIVGYELIDETCKFWNK